MWSVGTVFQFACVPSALLLISGEGLHCLVLSLGFRQWAAATHVGRSSWLVAQTGTPASVLHLQDSVHATLWPLQKSACAAIAAQLISVVLVHCIQHFVQVAVQVEIGPA